MEKNCNKIIIAIVSVSLFIIGFVGGYLAYDCIHKDKEETNKPVQTTEPTKSPDNSVKITYEVKDKKFYVNGKESEISNDSIYKYNVLGQIEDALVVSVDYMYSFSGLYLVDSEGKILYLLTPADAYYAPEESVVYLKGGYYRGDAKVEGNSIIVTTDNLVQDPKSVACEMDSTDLAEITEKVEYKNKKMGTVSTVSSKTAAEYIKQENITCK